MGRPAARDVSGYMDVLQYVENEVGYWWGLWVDHDPDGPMPRRSYTRLNFGFEREDLPAPIREIDPDTLDE